LARAAQHTDNRGVKDPHAEPGDEQLLAAARQGDADALETLILRYQPRIYRFGLKMCGDIEDARDVVQESLLAMARTIRSFRGDASVSTWLYTIARRFCIRKHRRSKFAPQWEESLDAVAAGRLADASDPAPDPEQRVAAREIDAALSAAIDALDDGQREVLVLRDMEGLSAPEVAEALGLSVDAVKSRLHRARLAVRERVAPVLGIPLPASQPVDRCRDVPMLFSRYLEGEIAPEICAEMEEHLEGCARCRGACQSLKRTLALCRASDLPDVPASLRESVRTAIRAFLQAS
jgi:RNA polymerase sigma-70 factor (ECF subfamily)